MQPEHRGQIPSWVAPARQQCSTFPLVFIVMRLYNVTVAVEESWLGGKMVSTTNGELAAYYRSVALYSYSNLRVVHYKQRVYTRVKEQSLEENVPLF